MSSSLALIEKLERDVIPLRINIAPLRWVTVSVPCDRVGNVIVVKDQDVENEPQGAIWIYTLCQLFDVERDVNQCLYKVYDRKEPSRG